MIRCKTLVLIYSLFLLFSSKTEGIIFYSTGDSAYNSSSPSGTLGESGWKLQGLWTSFLGTPIAPYYFITAKHVGGVVGQGFYFGGKSYTTTAVFLDKESDLAIWRVSEPFPIFASPYPKSDEVGKVVMVYGRGTQRGAEVRANGLLGSTLKGWRWGASDGVLRWGQNKVGSTILQSAVGMNGSGHLLKLPFEANGGPNEATLSVGDSGGGLFIQDGLVWKLAGINYSVDGDYNTTANGIGFGAAIFDEGGIYKGGEGNWQLIPDRTADAPSSFYATRISNRLSWIQEIINQPIPLPVPILEMATDLDGTFVEVSDADWNQTASTFSFPRPRDTCFFRVRNSTASKIKSISTIGFKVEVKI